MNNPKDIFSHIHATNMWNSKESVSGPGSTLEATAILRDRLYKILHLLQIRSMVDLPCGDVNYMQHIDLQGIDYTGCDIVEKLIEENTARFADRDNMRFQHLNALEDELPPADLLLCRDMIVHFPNEAALAFLDKVRASQCYFLLTTHFTGDYGQYPCNVDIDFGHWRPVKLTEAPFNLPPPILMIPEKEHNKTLALWEVVGL